MRQGHLSPVPGAGPPHPALLNLPLTWRPEGSSPSPLPPRLRGHPPSHLPPRSPGGAARSPPLGTKQQAPPPVSRSPSSSSNPPPQHTPSLMPTACRKPLPSPKTPLQPGVSGVAAVRGSEVHAPAGPRARRGRKEQGHPQVTYRSLLERSAEVEHGWLFGRRLRAEWLLGCWLPGHRRAHRDTRRRSRRHRRRAPRRLPPPHSGSLSACPAPRAGAGAEPTAGQSAAKVCEAPANGLAGPRVISGCPAA
jgi:hypothetical protein